MDTTMHYFNTEIAEKYGMVEATILNHLQYWITQNTQNNKNYHDGRYWTFHSIQAFCKQFPYLTAKKIRNAIKKLEDAKILVKGNFNKIKYDRTTWYALTDLGLGLFSGKKQEEKQKAELEQKPTAEPEPKVELEQKTAVEPETKVELEKPSTKKNTMQIPPNAEEVQAYCDERKNGVNVPKFMAYYQSVGWKMGKRKMTDWTAAVRYWEQTEHRNRQTATPATRKNGFFNFTGRDWDYDEMERLEQEKQRKTAQELENNGGW